MADSIPAILKIRGTDITIVSKQEDTLDSMRVAEKLEQLAASIRRQEVVCVRYATKDVPPVTLSGTWGQTTKPRELEVHLWFTESIKVVHG